MIIIAERKKNVEEKKSNLEEKIDRSEDFFFVEMKIRLKIIDEEAEQGGHV